MATIPGASDYQTLSDYRRPSDYDSRSQDPAGLRCRLQLGAVLPSLGCLRLPHALDRRPPLPLAGWPAADPGGPALLILPA